MTSAPARIRGAQRPADRIFRGGATFAGSLILVILAAVAIVLIAQSLPGCGSKAKRGGLPPSAS